MLRAHADADAVVWVLSRFDLEPGPMDHIAVLPAQPICRNHDGKPPVLSPAVTVSPGANQDRP